MLTELAFRLAVEEIAVHPPDPQQHHRRHHAGVGGGRPRAAGGQPARDRRRPAGARDDVLGQVRRPRQQPRRDRQGPEAHAVHAEVVPRPAPAGVPRSARIGDAAARVERHRPVLPGGRAHPGDRVVVARADRDHGDDQARRAWRLHLQLLRRLGPELHVLDRRHAQLDRPLLRDAELRRRRRGGGEPRQPLRRRRPRLARRAGQPAAAQPRRRLPPAPASARARAASGTVRIPCRPRASCGAADRTSTCSSRPS